MRQVDFQTLLDLTVSPIITEVAEYWHGLRGERAIPLRREIDPAGFRNALPYVWLIDCRDPDNLVHDLVGESIQDRWGMPFMGKTVAELYKPETVALMKQLVGHIKGTRCAMYGVTKAVDMEGYHSDIERVAVPFGDADSETVCHILGCSVSFASDYRGHKPGARNTRFDVDDAIYFVPE